MSTVTMLKNIISCEAAAKLIGCTRGRVRQLLRAGDIEGEKINARAWMVFRKSAEEYAKKQQPSGRPRISLRSA